MGEDQPYEGLEPFRFPEVGRPAHDVYRVGGGRPAVILLHELDGLGRSCQRLALHLSRRFTVYTPTLYGKLAPGDGPNDPRRMLHMLGGVAKLCVRREMYLLATAKRSRFTDWVERLAAHLHDEHGHQVGVIGMCMTGGVVLAALPHPSIGAGVSAQSALPWVKKVGNTARRRVSIGLSESELEEACGDPTPLKAFRFLRDEACPDERIAAIEACYSQAAPVRSLDEPAGSEGKLHPTLTTAFRPKPKGFEPRSYAEAQALSRAAVDEAADFLFDNLVGS